MLLIFGLGEMSKIVMVALGAFYPILINTVLGVVNLDKVYLDVGHNYRANRWQVFRTIALPGALPSIMAGIKLAMGMGLILMAISEMVAANDGIGYMILELVAGPDRRYDVCGAAGDCDPWLRILTGAR